MKPEESICDWPVMLRHAGLYQRLQQLPYQEVHRFLVTAREAELDLFRPDNRENWLAPVLEGVPALAHRAGAGRGSGGPPVGWARELADRVQDFLTRRNVMLCLLTLFAGDLNFQRQTLTVEGADLLADLTRAEPGCLLVPLHMGPYQWLPPLLAARGFRISSLTEAGAYEPLTQICETFLPETWRDMHFIPVPGDDVPRTCLRHLNEGRLLVVFPEFAPSMRPGGFSVPFLGTRIYAALGPALLAQRAGRPMVGVGFHAEGPLQFRLEFGPVWRVGPGRAGIEAATAGLFGWAEERVLAHPEQWWAWAIFEQAMRVPAEIGG